MKNRIRARSIIGIVLISILFILTANVYASTDSFKTSLSTNHSTLKRGEEVIVTIALSDIAIESGDKGIGAYTARIDFDSSVLEYVDTNGTDKWEAPFYQDALLVGNSDNGEVAKNAENIGTITFKVKEDAKLGETTIKLTNFSGSTGENDVVAEDSTITITIIAKDGESQGGSGSQSGNEGQGGSGNQSGTGSQSGSENQGGSGNQTGTGSQGGNAAGNGNVSGNGSTQNSQNSNKPSTGNTNKENIKPGTLPQTGSSNIAIFLSIGVLVVLAIICFIRIKLLKKKR